MDIRTRARARRVRERRGDVLGEHADILEQSFDQENEI